MSESVTFTVPGVPAPGGSKKAFEVLETRIDDLAQAQQERDAARAEAGRLREREANIRESAKLALYLLNNTFGHMAKEAYDKLNAALATPDDDASSMTDEEFQSFIKSIPTTKDLPDTEWDDL